MTSPAQASDLIETRCALRGATAILTYDPDQRTLRCRDQPAVTIGNNG